MSRLECAVLTDGHRSESFTLVAAALPVGLAVGWYALSMTESVTLMNALIAATVCYAAVIGLTLASGRGFWIVTALTFAFVVAASLSADDLDRQWADGAFWLIGGALVDYVMILAAWGVGGLVRAIWRAIVNTRGREVA
jgi:hypothetical protein